LEKKKQLQELYEQEMAAAGTKVVKDKKGKDPTKVTRAQIIAAQLAAVQSRNGKSKNAKLVEQSDVLVENMNALGNKHDNRFNGLPID
jgi:hypothetical protein